MLKSKIPYETTVAEVLIAVDKLTSEFDTAMFKKSFIECSSSDSLFKNPQLREVRTLIPRSIFRVVLESYVRSLPYSLEKISDSTFRVYNERHSYMVLLSSEKCSCSCGYLEKCLLPCHHILRVATSLKESFSRFVHQRWRLFSATELDRGHQALRGKPINSRKNKR